MIREFEGYVSQNFVASSRQKEISVQLPHNKKGQTRVNPFLTISIQLMDKVFKKMLKSHVLLFINILVFRDSHKNWLKVHSFV